MGLNDFRVRLRAGTSLGVAGVLVVLAAGGCTQRSSAVPAAAVPDPGAPAPQAHTHHEQSAPAVPGAHPADVRFMQDMIGHHEQALVMAAMAATHGASEQILRLAEKIDISQRDEIAMMKQWLSERGQPIPADDHAHHAHMPGMLTAEQLARLDVARGRAFDRLFLTFMIQHHEGALVMVDTLFASPGAAQDADIFRFATDVATDQLDEIDVMAYMLESIPTGGSESR